MTSLFPHPPYAEDQPSSHSILYLHTARAGAMTGSFIGLLTAPTVHLLSSRRSKTSFTSAPPATTSQLLPRLLTHSGRGLIFGALFGVVATFGRMYGREDIEWQDRAWRLLENRGEVRTDWVSFGGTGVGALAAGMARLGGGLSGGRRVLGGAGVGMAVGVGYMVSTFARGRKNA